MVYAKQPKIQVGYGLGKGDDSFATGVKAAEQAIANVSEHALSAVLVFASVQYDLGELLSGIHKVVGGVPVLGATTAGEICDGLQQESVVVVALASPYLRVRVGVGQTVSKNWQNAVNQALSSPELLPFFSPQDSTIWHELTRKGKEAFGLLFSPGNTRHADSHSYGILEKLKRLSDGRLPIFGGAAADDWQMEVNYVLYGQQAYPDSVLVAVFETSLQFGTALAHGFFPTRQRATANRVREHEVLEFDGQPAAEVYARMLGCEPEALEGKHLTLTSGRLVGSSDPHGQYCINVASYFTAAGGVRLTQPVPEGTNLTMMQAEIDNLIVAGQDALRKALLRGQISDPAVILVFSCALRHSILGERVGEEISKMKEMMPGVPVVGFYSFGEQGLADDGANRHNNAVITVLVIGQDLSYAVRVAMENKRLRKELEKHIGERKQSDEMARESEAKYIDFYDNAPDMYVSVDAETARILQCNQTLADNLGYAKEEIIGRLIFDMYHPDCLEKVNKTFRSFVETGQVRDAELQLKGKHGAKIDVSLNASAVRDEAGKILHSRSSWRDITERKRLEESLRRSEERFKELAELLPETIFEIDLEASVTYVNRKAFEHFGYTQQDFDQGLNALDMIVPDDRKRAMGNIAQILSGEDVGLNEYTALRKDGTTFPAMIHSAPIIHNGRPTGLRGFIIDISETKHLQNQLQHAQKMEAVGTLAGGVAHDFNNLLQAVRGYAQLLILEKDSKDPDYSELQEIMQAVDRGAELTRQLLTFSRKVESDKRPLLLNHEVAAVKKLLERTLPKMIELETQLANDPKLVNADPLQIEQVIMNLALNAADAMPEGGKLIIACENFTMSEAYCQAHPRLRPGDYVMLAVSDTGHGIGRESLENLFDPFYTTKEVGKGTGLGLAVVYGIVKDHDGHIICHSKSGEGTSFKIYLPVTERETDMIEKSESESPPEGGTETILLVDDEGSVLDLGERILTRFGYTVMTACSGEKALELYRQNKEQIDLVILDLIMPGMGGTKCLEELLKLNSHIQVLIASGYSSEDGTKEEIKKRARGSIIKPYNITQILKAVREVLDEDRSR
jgi:PAS domain S-box-containing protein